VLRVVGAASSVLSLAIVVLTEELEEVYDLQIVEATVSPETDSQTYL
jgi:hypothetical protein